MKMFYTFTQDFYPMVENFVESIKDSPEELKLHPIMKNYGYNGEIGGGKEGFIARKEMIDKALDATADNEWFIISDVDVVFYQPVMPYIMELISTSPLRRKDNDTGRMYLSTPEIYFQKENDLPKLTHGRFVNVGFMLMKNCLRVKKFWDDIYRAYFSTEQLEQTLTNAWLQFSSSYFVDINTQHHATHFFPTYGYMSNDIWNMTLGLETLDKSIILHHANQATTQKEKFVQFRKIKNIVANKTEGKSSFMKKQLGRQK